MSAMIAALQHQEADRVREIGKQLEVDRKKLVEYVNAALGGTPHAEYDALTKWQKAGVIDEIRWALDVHIDEIFHELVASARLAENRR